MKQLFILFTVFVLNFSIYGQEIDSEEASQNISEPILEDISELSEKDPLLYSIVEITKKNYKEIFRSERPLVVDFYTTWCGPCKHMHKVIEELNHEYGELYQFGKINAEKERFLATMFGVGAFPTLIFIKEGKVVGRQKGFIGKDAFLQKIEKYFQEVPPFKN